MDASVIHSAARMARERPLNLGARGIWGTAISSHALVLDDLADTFKERRGIGLGLVAYQFAGDHQPPEDCSEGKHDE